MLPELDLSTSDLLEPITTDLKGDTAGKVFLFDFKTNRHVIRDGRLVEATELQAIEQWIELQIRTSFKKKALEKLASSKTLPTDFVHSELARELLEVLMVHPSIVSVEDFKVSVAEGALLVCFTVVTNLGEVEREVNLLV